MSEPWKILIILSGELTHPISCHLQLSMYLSSDQLLIKSLNRTSIDKALKCIMKDLCQVDIESFSLSLWFMPSCMNLIYIMSYRPHFYILKMMEYFGPVPSKFQVKSIKHFFLNLLSILTKVIYLSCLFHKLTGFF